MYEKTIILTVLLLSGYSSSQLTTESVSMTHETPVRATTVQSPHVVTTEALQFNIHGDGLLEHIFSAGEITGIVYAVMAGIIGTILSIAFCIKRLTKKTPFPVQTAQPEDADPESSVETRNPEQ